MPAQANGTESMYSKISCPCESEEGQNTLIYSFFLRTPPPEFCNAVTVFFFPFSLVEIKAPYP